MAYASSLVTTTSYAFILTSMWIAGITQVWCGELMMSMVHFYIHLWYGEVLHPYYTLRAIGGLFYLIGFFMFAFNMYKTATRVEFLKKNQPNASPYGIKEKEVRVCFIG